MIPKPQSARSAGPRLFVAWNVDTDCCRNCYLPEREHRGHYRWCPITGPSSVEYAASVGAEWAVGVMRRYRSRQREALGLPQAGGPA